MAEHDSADVTVYCEIQKELRGREKVNSVAIGRRCVDVALLTSP